MAIQLKRKHGAFTDSDKAQLLEGQPAVNLDNGELIIGLGDGTAINVNSRHQSIEQGSGSGSIQQIADGVADGFTSGNTLAQEIDSTLSGTISYGAIGNYSVALGGKSSAQGKRSFAAGSCVIAKGNYSHAEGNESVTLANNAHAEGFSTVAAGISSHAEGELTIAMSQTSHAEGRESRAIGVSSHAEGNSTRAEGANSHTEGCTTLATGSDSHAEGLQTTASNSEAHAEGCLTIASGIQSHAEGKQTTASGSFSHTEGLGTLASGPYSHSGGLYSESRGEGSFAHGIRIQATDAQTAFGIANVGNNDNAFEIGGGKVDSNSNVIFRRNLLAVTRDGRAKIDAAPEIINDNNDLVTLLSMKDRVRDIVWLTDPVRFDYSTYVCYHGQEYTYELNWVLKNVSPSMTVSVNPSTGNVRLLCGGSTKDINLSDMAKTSYVSGGDKRSGFYIVQKDQFFNKRDYTFYSDLSLTLPLDLGPRADMRLNITVDMGASTTEGNVTIHSVCIRIPDRLADYTYKIASSSFVHASNCIAETIHLDVNTIKDWVDISNAVVDPRYNKYYTMSKLKGFSLGNASTSALELTVGEIKGPGIPF